MYATLEKVDDVDRATMVANVMYSYDVIRTAAQTLARTPEFMNCPVVQKLKFSPEWVEGWLRRRAMRKRRCSTQVKEVPNRVCLL